MRDHLLLSAAALTSVALLAAACTSDSPASTGPLAANAAAGAAQPPVSVRSVVPVAGGVYTATNESSGNAIVAYARGSSGALTYIGTYPTQGNGNSQIQWTSEFSIVLGPASATNQTLYAVDAGSNDIAVFHINADASLTWLQNISSGDLEPVSLATHHNRLYVLNHHYPYSTRSASIGAYSIAENGTLTSLNGGHVVPLPPDFNDPYAIRVSGNGVQVMVSEPPNSRLDIFPLDNTGIPGAPYVDTLAQYNEPSGFDVGHDQEVVTVGAGGFQAYKVPATGGLTLVNPDDQTNSAGGTQMRITGNVQEAFAVNRNTSQLSAFGIGGSGRLHPFGSPYDLPSNSFPIEIDISRDSKFIYILEFGTGAIEAYQIHGNSPVTFVQNVPNAVPKLGPEAGLAAW